VIGLRFVDAQDFHPGRGIDHIRIGVAYFPRSNDSVMIQRRRVGIGEIRSPGDRFARIGKDSPEARALRIVESRIEGETKQSAFVIRGGKSDHASRHIQERRSQALTVLHDPDLPGLIDDEEPLRGVRRGNQIVRRNEAACHAVEIHPDRTVWNDRWKWIVRIELRVKRRASHSGESCESEAAEERGSFHDSWRDCVTF
jgi:hypothetical protein